MKKWMWVVGLGWIPIILGMQLTGADHTSHENAVRIGGADLTAGVELDVRKSESSTATALYLTNESNTAGSDAWIRAVAGGTSGGDSVFQSRVIGGTIYSWGSDNSDTDRWKLSEGSALGTGDLMIAEPTNDGMIFPNDVRIGGTSAAASGIELDVRSTISGGEVTLEVKNDSNTASSDATIRSEVAGTSARDARFQANISGPTKTYTWGIDNSTTNDDFILSRSGSLGTNNVLVAHSADELDFPGQPTARVTGTGTQSVTGAAITWASEDWDVGDMHSTVSNTSRITIPVAGKYMVGAILDWACSGTITNGPIAVRFHVNNLPPLLQVFERDASENTSGADVTNTSMPMDLSANDFVEVKPFEGFDGSCTILRSASWFWVYKTS